MPCVSADIAVCRRPSGSASGLTAGSKHLGRSWLNVTSNVYGHFDKTRRREAPAMAETLGI